MISETISSKRGDVSVSSLLYYLTFPLFPVFLVSHASALCLC